MQNVKMMKNVYGDYYRNRSIERILPRDYFGLLLFFFIVFSMTVFGENQLKLIGIVLSGSYAFYFLKQKESLPTELLIYLAWFSWSVSGYAVAIDKEAFLTSFFLVLQIAVMNVAIVGITFKRATLHTNFLAFIIGGIILFYSSTSEFQYSMDPDQRYQLTGVMSNPNAYAYALLLSVISIMYFWRNTISWKMRPLLISLIAIFAFGILMSGSRKAFIGLTVLILMWLWICYRKDILRRRSILLLFIFSIFALSIFVYYMLNSTYMGQRFREDFVENSITERPDDYKRVVYYEEGVQMIKEEPLFGVGLGNFAVRSVYGKYSHSDFIEVASSTGIIGFILYFSVYCLLWRRLNRLQKGINDDIISYNIKLMKISIIVILLLSSGRTNVYSLTDWLVLSSFIGYAWSLERKMISLRKYLQFHQFKYNNGT